ncbi:hemagglutinin [Microbacterium sp. CH12i]|nr:hemagglutinin [Microbacterium sp. CH12i]
MARFVTVLVAVTAVVVGTVAPVTAATASATVSTTAGLARTSVGTAQSGIVKTAVTGFNPGNIISDAVFFNKNTMSAADIQAFFNGKVASCQSGYVCLKDARQNTPNRPADQYCSGYSGAPNESAATIIYRVAQSCGINPQVLVVMLQKEQGLVTHTWPSQWRYDMALGQGCPDTAPCDPAFAGFFYQIYGAARQMQIYAEGRWFQWYAPGNTWNILYHPNANCGRSPVYIENKATAALYYYTPYQPNAAALAAGYGEANNACSSYGNRNFYNYFTDWFGVNHADDPIGNVEVLEANPGEFRVVGWAGDVNSPNPIQVHVYVGGVGIPTVANIERPDVAYTIQGLGAGEVFLSRFPRLAQVHSTCASMRSTSARGLIPRSTASRLMR